MPTDDWEFWVRLARRMTDVLRSSRDNKIRFLWGDDVLSDSLLLATGEKSMLAIDWVRGGKCDGQYRVKLSFSEMAAEAYRCGKRTELLPDADSTEWFKISPIDQYIEVDIA